MVDEDIREKYKHTGYNDETVKFLEEEYVQARKEEQTRQQNEPMLHNFGKIDNIETSKEMKKRYCDILIDRLIDCQATCEKYRVWFEAQDRNNLIYTNCICYRCKDNPTRD